MATNNSSKAELAEQRRREAMTALDAQRVAREQQLAKTKRLRALRMAASDAGGEAPPKRTAAATKAKTVRKAKAR